MRCNKPNTDHVASFKICANGRPCAEYSLPPTTSKDTNANVIECLIPVEEGDQLTISGLWTGSILHGAFDVVADGSWLSDKRIEGTDGEVKFYKDRRVDVKTVFDFPDEELRGSSAEPDDLVEGVLEVRALADDDIDQLSEHRDGALSVGCLAIICSVNQDTSDNYKEKFSSMTCGDWKKPSNQVYNDGGLPAEFELGVKTTDDTISRKRSSRHMRHFQQTRFGTEPWANLIFYYRSQKAIDDAGAYSSRTTITPLVQHLAASTSPRTMAVVTHLQVETTASPFTEERRLHRRRSSLVNRSFCRRAAVQPATLLPQT